MTTTDPVDDETGARAEGPSDGATKRDSAATDRDHVSAERDIAAKDRDHNAESRDLISTKLDVSTGHADHNAAADRSASGEDRHSAADDRQHAADDRDAAATDRSLAATDSESLLHDHLTGVYGRRGGLEELHRDIAKARRTQEPFVLAFIDVDRLRDANDAGGHEAGDLLLVRVAEAIRGVVRGYDIVLRYGGDEFMCGFLGMDLAGARVRFEQLNSTLAATGGGSASVGLAQLQEGEDLEHLVARADTAMYQSKRLNAASASQAPHV